MSILKWLSILFNSHSGGWSPNWVHSARRPLRLWWWSIWWNEDWQGKPKYSEETCPSVTLSTTNPTCQTQARTRATAVGSQRLTTWAMARSLTLYLLGKGNIWIVRNKNLTGWIEFIPYLRYEGKYTVDHLRGTENYGPFTFHNWSPPFSPNKKTTYIYIYKIKNGVNMDVTRRIKCRTFILKLHFECPYLSILTNACWSSTNVRIFQRIC
jgi:hypothetical protein